MILDLLPPPGKERTVVVGQAMCRNGGRAGGTSSQDCFNCLGCSPDSKCGYFMRASGDIGTTDASDSFEMLGLPPPVSLALTEMKETSSLHLDSGSWCSIQSRDRP